MPFIALGVLLVLLFPVISVSDDLWTMQNPAEIDCSVRRDHVPGAQHILFPTAALPEDAFFGLTLISKRSIDPSVDDAPVNALFANATLSRPPPAA